MADRDTFLDDIDALIAKHAPTLQPSAAPSSHEDPVLSEVDRILAPYEVPQAEREATGIALEVGQWPGDESIRSTIEKGGRKAFDAARESRLPQLRQVQKARDTESALREADRFTTRATDFFTSLITPSTPAPAPASPSFVAPQPHAPLPVPAWPSVTPAQLTNISKADKSAAGDVMLAYKRRDIYSKYAAPEDLDRMVNGRSLRDVLAKTTRKPANPESIAQPLPSIQQVVARYKEANPLERGSKVGPGTLHPFERAAETPEEPSPSIPDVNVPEVTVTPEDQPDWLRPAQPPATIPNVPLQFTDTSGTPTRTVFPSTPAPIGPAHTIGDDLGEAAKNFMQGAAGVSGDALKAIAIASKTLDDYMPEALQNPAEIKDRLTYKIGQTVQDLAKQAFPTDPTRQDEFMVSVLPKALGSMTAFLAGGVGGAALKAPVITTALLGAGAQGTQQFEDAAQHGADPATQQKAFFLGLPVGASEAIPIEGLLSKFNQATGGRFMHILKTAGTAAAQEFAQEFFQTAAGNVIAKDILAYDAERSRLEGAGQAGAAGGASGGILGLLVGALGGRRAHVSQTGAADVPADRVLLAQGTDAVAPATPSAPPPLPGVSPQLQAALPDELQIAQRPPFLIRNQDRVAAPPSTPPPPFGPPSPEVRRFDELMERYTLPTARQIAERKLAENRPVPMPWETVAAEPDALPSQRQVTSKKLEQKASQERVEATKERPRPGVEIPILERPAAKTTETPKQIEVVTRPTPRERLKIEQRPEDVQMPAEVQKPTPVERPTPEERPTPVEKPKPVPKPDAITPEMREAMDYVNQIEEPPAPVTKPKSVTRASPQQPPAPVQTDAAGGRPDVNGSSTTTEETKSSKLVDAQQPAPLPVPASSAVEKQEVTPAPITDRIGFNHARRMKIVSVDGNIRRANPSLSFEASAKLAEEQVDAGLADGSLRFNPKGKVRKNLFDPGSPMVTAPVIENVTTDTAVPKTTAATSETRSPFETTTPVLSQSTAPIDIAAHEAATSPTNTLPEPTQPMKEAGNYQKGHIKIAGLDISIENPHGSTRSGTNAQGKPWSVIMGSHYGYIRSAQLNGERISPKGRDKDHLDVFVKPGTPEDYHGPVYVIDQKNPSTDRFDEHKIVMGAGSLQEAKRLYHENYAKGWKGMQAATRFTMPEFKDWLKSGDHKKPAMNQVPIVPQEESNTPTFLNARPAATVPVKNSQASSPTVSKSPNPTMPVAVTRKRREVTDQSVIPPQQPAPFPTESPSTGRQRVTKATPAQRTTVQHAPQSSSPDNGAPIRDLGESSAQPDQPADRRSRGIPAEADPPISSYRTNDTVKAHPDYRAAKAGDTEAAIRLVRDLVNPETLEAARRRFSGAVFASAMAQEATGANAIPHALAMQYADAAGGTLDNRIEQINKVFHTGADPMERLISRPRFRGPVTRGARYVIVDDVTTLGGTLAEMANYIQQGGGHVIGVVTLTNASRSEKLATSRARIQLIEQRFGDVVRELFEIDPTALTASEAGYLGNFRDADTLRTRGAAARTRRNERSAAQGLSQRDDSGVADATSAPDSSDSDSSPPDFGSPPRDVSPVTSPEGAPSARRSSLTHLTDIERHAHEVADDFLGAVDQAKNAPRPTRPRIPVAPILGGPSKSLSDIVIDVQKGTGKKLMTGKPGRGLGGVYKPGSSTTLIRYHGDLDTTAHELAHALDDQYGIVKNYAGKPTSPFDAELKPFAEHGSATLTGPRSSPTYWRAEGVAEWTRAWIVNPQAAIAAAPQFAKHFEQAIPAHIKQALTSFSDDVRRQAGHSAHAKIMANVEWETPKSPLLAWLTGTRTAPGPGFQLTFGDQLATELTDRLTPFMKALKYAQGQRGSNHVLPGKDPALLARLYSGINAKIDDIFEHGMIDSKLERATPGGLKWLLEPLDPLDPKALEQEMQEVASLMIAERTMEKARQLERDRVSGIGAGIESDVAVARQRLTELKQDKAKYARLQEAASRYRQWADANLQYLVDKGRLSAEQYHAIKQNNEFYVAMQRLIEVSPGEEVVVSLPRGTAGRKLGTVGQPVKSFHGSTRTIKNPYHSLMDATNQAIREADRNEVLSLFRELLTMNRSMHQGQVPELASVGRKAESGEKHTIPIYTHGEKEIWQFHPEVYKALKGVEEGAYKFPWALTILPRILRATIVNAPPFALRNLIRDAWQRTIVSRVGSKPWDVLKPYSLDEVQKFQQSGGDQAGHYYTGPKDYARALQFAMKELSGSHKSILVDPLRLGQGYLNLMQGSERQGRMAEYRRAFDHAKKEFGYDDYHASLWAAGQARDLLDFAVAGNWTQLVNQLVPFTNAAVQGLRRNIKGARENPSGVALRFGIYALVPSLVNFAWNYLFGKGDDLDEYRALPAYQRDLFYNYKLGPDHWLSIPKAFEVGVLATTFERAMDYGLGNAKAFEGHVGAFLRTLLPVDEAAFGGPFQGIFQAVANYDFFRDRPIVPRYEENLALELRNTHRASRLGQALQSAIGVDARKLDFVLEQQFGYFGRYATKASDIGREDKRGFGADAIGLFRGSPGTAALDVQKIKEIATERGLVASRGKSVEKYQTVSAVPSRPTENMKNPDAVRFGVFRKLLDAYYDAKTPEARDAAAKVLRREAAALRTIWEKTPPRPQAEEKAEITRKRDTGEMSKDDATKAFKDMLKPKRPASAPFPLQPTVSP